MAYDQELAEPIRRLIGSDPDLTEKKMSGGLAFLIRGNMPIAASSQGGSWSVPIRGSPLPWSRRLQRA
jgi:hypothetical protein